MKQAKAFLPIFSLFLLIAFLILFFFQTPLLKPIQVVTVPVQSWLFATVTARPEQPNNQQDLQRENDELRLKLVKMNELEKENQALRDQFDLSDQAPRNLTGATVVGSKEHALIIDKGQDDGLTNGDVVIVKNNLLGKITKVSPHLSQVSLLTDPQTSFTVHIVKHDTLGVVKAEGGTLILDKVVLSDKIEKNDIVQTKGDLDEKGNGFPPDLIVGKLTSVNKQESSLFQTAKIESLVDVATLRTVFVIVK